MYAAEENPLWPSTAPSAVRRGALDQDRCATAAIVGCGFTGASAALFLAQRGVDTVVLEAEDVGWGASGRNAGGVIGTWPGFTPSEVEKKHGLERGRRLNSLIADGTKLLQQIVADYSIDADLRLDGAYMAAHARNAKTRLSRLAREWSDIGNSVAIVEGDRLRETLRTDRYDFGVCFENAGTVQPLAYTRGLADAAEREGAQIYTNSPATDILREGSRWTIATPQARVRTDWVILATNAYTPRFNSALRRAFYRTPAWMAASAPIKDAAEHLPAAGLSFMDAHPLNLFSFWVTTESRIVASLLPSSARMTAPADVARPFERKLRRVFGALPPIEWTHAWSGKLAVTPDRLPRVFELGPNFIAPAGYSGCGVANAAVMGREVANAVAEDSREACAFAFTPPAPVPAAEQLPDILRRFVYPALRLSDRWY
ncbi:MAG: FAD-dependent oxidoreductase [Pseudomonadota bacterium]